MWRIKDWNRLFETSESRKIKSLSKVMVPNKHDGKGFSRISRRPDACEIFCAWILMLQLASKMPIRGDLADGDGPLSYESMADKTRYPATIFETACKVLSSNEIRWIEDVQPGDCPDVPGDCPDTPALTERNGTERNGKKTEVNSGRCEIPISADGCFFSGSPEEAWGRAWGLAIELADKFHIQSQNMKSRDRQLVLRAAYLAVTRFSEAWFRTATSEVCQAEGVRTTFGLWKKCLWKLPERQGIDLNALLDEITVPDKRPSHRGARKDDAK
jgi:hypothetical protein